MSNTFLPGNLVQARGRTWVVQSGSEDDWLKLRPIGGADDEITELMPQLEREPVELAQFPLPDPTKFGTLYSSAELLYDALRFQLRSGAGPSGLSAVSRLSRARISWCPFSWQCDRKLCAC